jgi:hypothetical protein
MRTRFQKLNAFIWAHAATLESGADAAALEARLSALVGMFNHVLRRSPFAVSLQVVGLSTPRAGIAIHLACGDRLFYLLPLTRSERMCERICVAMQVKFSAMERHRKFMVSRILTERREQFLFFRCLS